MYNKVKNYTVYIYIYLEYFMIKLQKTEFKYFLLMNEKYNFVSLKITPEVIKINYSYTQIYLLFDKSRQKGSVLGSY